FDPLSGPRGGLFMGSDPCGLPCERDLDVEDGSPAVVRLDPDPAFDTTDQVAADVEPEARPSDPAGHVWIDSVELLEDPPLLGGRDRSEERRVGKAAGGRGGG